MPKPLRKEVRDPNRSAFRVLQHTIAGESDGASKKSAKRGAAKPKEPALPAPPKGLSEYMAALGRKGGTVSGARRMANLTTQERRAIALKAARARWAKEKRERD
jgi:hypothetical protein